MRPPSCEKTVVASSLDLIRRESCAAFCYTWAPSVRRCCWRCRRDTMIRRRTVVTRTMLWSSPLTERRAAPGEGAGKNTEQGGGRGSSLHLAEQQGTISSPIPGNQKTRDECTKLESLQPFVQRRSQARDHWKYGTAPLSRHGVAMEWHRWSRHIIELQHEQIHESLRPFALLLLAYTAYTQCDKYSRSWMTLGWSYFSDSVHAGLVTTVQACPQVSSEVTGPS
nr:hypothetical protein CFP56_76641 [Quercus suber]